MFEINMIVIAIIGTVIIITLTINTENIITLLLPIIIIIITSSLREWHFTEINLNYGSYM